MTKHPHLLEINTQIFLQRLSEKAGRRLALAAVPEEIWKGIRGLGFDFIWLMGIWKRGPASQALARQDPSLRKAFEKALPDLTPEDIGGSPYAVYDYAVEPSFGTDSDLEALRRRLRRLGMGLILDFVPNHLAWDHPWTRSAPERFVHDGPALAHGRDPHFPPWQDTAQVNFFSEGLRLAFKKEVLRIASFCDGLRCDMAMLGLNEIFEKNWGARVKGPRPKQEFWSEIIPDLKKARPDFLLMAEVYWGLEWRLQELGFDFTYDKTLYDRLRRAGAREIEDHLRPGGPFQNRSAHFIENHDEERSLTAFGPRAKPAAVILSTIPGLRFFHDGQLEGKTRFVPIQLKRGPREAANPDVLEFYQGLLALTQKEVFHEGRWEMLKKLGPSDAFLGWRWTLGKTEAWVLVNYGPQTAGACFEFPGPKKMQIDWTSPKDGLLNCSNAAGRLNLKMKAWGACILKCTGS